MTYKLDPILGRDTVAVTDYPLCEIRLMDNKLFPWLVLIPKRAGASEWIDLEREDQHQLSDEIAMVSHIFKALVTPDKLNIAALGNQVKQLHIHVIGRYAQDSAWPNPVWGRGNESYGEAERKQFIYELKTALESAL
jgi:diadenosine tetraphosphate (Ap4A) HIT family hydrolase